VYIDRERLMRRLKALYRAARQAESGQGMVEYAAILTFVAAVLVVAVTYLGPHIALTLNNVANSF
jgi:Flp pilus assembly pilin Flp